MSYKTIGSILLDSGKITPKQADHIIEVQANGEGRFGDTAVSLGYVTESDIKYALSQQFHFSYLMPGDESIDESLISAFVTDGPDIEALKALRSQLIFRWFEENKSLVVCGAVNGCGASYVAANLSVLFAQLGKKTLLVDANFRNPSQHLYFRSQNKFGFSHILVDTLDLDAIKGIKGLKNLSVLFAGAIPPNPVELFEQSNFSREQKMLEENYDVIIFDAPPINIFTESQLITSIVGGCLLIAKKDQTEIADLKVAKTKIENVKAIPVGVAVNEFKTGISPTK